MVPVRPLNADDPDEPASGRGPPGARPRQLRPEWAPIGTEAATTRGAGWPGPRAAPPSPPRSAPVPHPAPRRGRPPAAATAGARRVDPGRDRSLFPFVLARSLVGLLAVVQEVRP